MSDRCLSEVSVPGCPESPSSVCPKFPSLAVRSFCPVSVRSVRRWLAGVSVRCLSGVSVAGCPESPSSVCPEYPSLAVRCLSGVSVAGCPEYPSLAVRSLRQRRTLRTDTGRRLRPASDGHSGQTPDRNSLQPATETSDRHWTETPDSPVSVRSVRRWLSGVSVLGCSGRVRPPGAEATADDYRVCHQPGDADRLDTVTQ